LVETKFCLKIKTLKFSWILENVSVEELNSLNIRSIGSFVLVSGVFLVLFLSTNLIDVSGASIAEVKIPQGVNEGGNHFEPETLKISKGTTVKWTNEDDSIHTVTSGTPETSSWGTKFDSS